MMTPERGPVANKLRILQTRVLSEQSRGHNRQRSLIVPVFDQ